MCPCLLSYRPINFPALKHFREKYSSETSHPHCAIHFAPDHHLLTCTTTSYASPTNSYASPTNSYSSPTTLHLQPCTPFHLHRFFGSSLLLICLCDAATAGTGSPFPPFLTAQSFRAKSEFCSVVKSIKIDLLTLGPGQPPFLPWPREGGENEPDEDVCKTERANSDEFGLKVCEIAAAQICEGVGFEEVKKYTLVALSQMVVKYISDLAKSATYNAHLAGRSQSNVFDVLKGLEDLGGCSISINHNTSGSIVNQMSEFVQDMEIPFSNPIPRFPVISRRGITQGPSFLQMGETLGIKHIPDWLPAFLDPHTYLNTPLWNQRELDLRIDKGEQARQRRKAERSLLNLQQRLLSNALAGTSASGAHSGPYVANHHDQSLALPSTKGNKDVVENSDHPRKHVLVIAPVVEALKGDGTNGVSDSEAMDIDRRVTPISISVSNKRPPVVHFKLKAAGKKMV